MFSGYRIKGTQLVTERGWEYVKQGIDSAQQKSC